MCGHGAGARVRAEEILPARGADGALEAQLCDAEADRRRCRRDPIGVSVSCIVPSLVLSFALA
jgi:hypothetical protein